MQIDTSTFSEDQKAQWTHVTRQFDDWAASQNLTQKFVEFRDKCRSDENFKKSFMQAWKLHFDDCTNDENLQGLGEFKEYSIGLPKLWKGPLGLSEEFDWPLENVGLEYECLNGLRPERDGVSFEDLIAGVRIKEIARGGKF